METIERYSDYVNTIIELVKPIENRSMPFNLSPEEYLKELRQWNIVFRGLNLYILERDLWESQDQFLNSSDVVAFVNSYFSMLFAWKEGINTVEELLHEIDKDAQSLMTRASSLKITEFQIDSIKKEHGIIGIKLLKLKYEYKEIISNFLSKAKATKSLKSNQPLNYQFKLNPDKTNTVGQYLNTIIDEGYFLDENPEFSCTKSDILNAIGTLFSCNFQELTHTQSNPLPVAFQDKQSTEVIPITNSNHKHSEESTAIASFLLYSDKATLALKIKEVFNIEKGKSIRLIIKALEEYNPPLIAYGNRGFKAVYHAFKETFARDIGSYQSVKGYYYNQQADQQDYEAIQLKLNHILKDISVQEIQLD